MSDQAELLPGTLIRKSEVRRQRLELRAGETENR